MCRIKEDSEAVIVLLQQSDDTWLLNLKKTLSSVKRKGNREREREKERALAISSFPKDAPESLVPFLNVQLG